MTSITPTQSQRIAIETQGRALMVEAGAGTGKTWVLVERFMHLLEKHQEWPLESLVAITFTKKAAREMRTRLRAKIENRPGQHPPAEVWQSRRRNLDRLQVSTLHSLCARILRENAITAEIDPRFQVLEEQDAALLKEEAIRITLQNLSETDHPALELLDSLRVLDLREVMEDMLSRRGTLTSLFGAFESEEVLLKKWADGLETMRIDLWSQKLTEKPEIPGVMDEILEIEIVDPTDKLAPAVEHAQAGVWAARQDDHCRAVEQWAQINRSGGRMANWGGKEVKEYLSKELLAPLQKIGKDLQACFAVEIGTRDESAAQNIHLMRVLWEQLDSTYTELKSTYQALDFDDLELFTDNLLRKTPHTPRLQASLDGINHLMVDEFQDTNLIQQRIVYALAPVSVPGKLFVVGDAKQSIYRFRQAQVSLFNSTKADILATTGSSPVPLNTSFRTHNTLVKTQNYIFDKLLSPLSGEHDTYEAQPGPLKADRPSHPSLTTPVEIVLLPTRNARDKKISAADARVLEARWLARRLLQLRSEKFQVWDRDAKQYRDFEFKDAAILFRATTSLPLYEAEFKTARLPYLTVSGWGYYDRPEVQDLLALLATLANPADDLNLATALRSPLFALSDETLYRLRWWDAAGKRQKEPILYHQAVAQPPKTDQPESVARANEILQGLRDQAGRTNVWSLLRKVLDLTGFEATLAWHDREVGRQRTNVQKLLVIAREHGETSLPTFLAQLRDFKTREAREGEALGREPESGAVQLMSVHASKGLEFPVVVVADLGRQKHAGYGSSYFLHDPDFGLACKVRDEWGDWQKPAGYVWAKWLHDKMEEAECKRLLYVACTRAADLLILSGRVGTPKSWLAEIQAAFNLEAEGAEEEAIACEKFSLRVVRPKEIEPFSGLTLDMDAQTEGLAVIPPLARPISPPSQFAQIAVTRLEADFNRDEEEIPTLQPAIWYPQRQPTSKPRAPGYQIGNIVHRALAHWACLTFPEDELRALLINYARREGVRPAAHRHAVGAASRILSNLRSHPLYEQIQQAQRRYHELPFIVNSAVGTLHGVIDLLYQNSQDEWHLLDWKTERVLSNEAGERARQHMKQLAVYSRAAEIVVGVRAEVWIVFLNPDLVQYNISEEQLADVWQKSISLPR